MFSGRLSPHGAAMPELGRFSLGRRRTTARRNYAFRPAVPRNYRSARTFSRGLKKAANHGGQLGALPADSLPKTGRYPPSFPQLGKISFYSPLRIVLQVVRMRNASAKKNPAAVELGRLGAKARNSKLTPTQRSENARNAVLARWAKTPRSMRAKRQKKTVGA